MPPARKLAADLKKIAPEMNGEYAEAVAAKVEAEESAYVDQEDEWTDVQPQILPFGQEQSEARGILADMHAGKDRGLSSRTALSTDDQAAAMMEIRVMHQHYPKFGFDEIAVWLESYRISLGRAGRKEDVDILRGNVPVQSAPSPDGQRPRTW